jgi:hypothetical protein
MSVIYTINTIIILDIVEKKRFTHFCGRMEHKSKFLSAGSAAERCNQKGKYD